MMPRNPSLEVFGVTGVQIALNCLVSTKVFRNRNMSAIPLILIPEYGQSNAALETFVWILGDL